MASKELAEIKAKLPESLILLLASGKSRVLTKEEADAYRKLSSQEGVVEEG